LFKRVRLLLVVWRAC